MASNKNECVKYAQKYNRQNELPFIYFASEFRMVILRIERRRRGNC